MTRLKVLFVITKANFGGAQRYVHDLSLAAARRGHEVVVAHGGGGLLADRLRGAGIRTVSLPTLGRDVALGADLRSFVALLRLVHGEAPDVLHLNSSKAGVMGALAARLVNLAALLSAARAARRRVAAVFTGHGWAFNEERGPLSRLALRLLHWLTILLSHRVIAVSEATRRQVASLPLARRRIRVIHNGVGALAPRGADEAWARIVDGTAWRERRPARPAVVVGTLAELHRNKGLAYAVEAIALLRARIDPPLAFTILGDGEERAALSAQVRRLALEDTVLLAGFREDARELLGALDVFLLSSITEAFPYALLEAGMAGVPIVATRVGGVPDLVADAITGLLVPPRDPEAIARAVLQLVEHPEARARLGQQVRARVAESFSLDRMTGRTFALYRAVTRRARGAASRRPGAR